MTGVFLQARLGSTRLPRKVLLPFHGEPLIASAMRRLKCVPADVYVLATDFKSAAELLPVADACGWETYAGKADDVLFRFICAAAFFGVDTIVRATGDNPLVDAEFAEFILDAHLDTRADYSAYQGLPRGRGVEVVQRKALIRAYRCADAYEREHVTPYLYRHPEAFLLHRPLVPPWMRGGPECTVDTVEQYEALKRLF